MLTIFDCTTTRFLEEVKDGDDLYFWKAGILATLIRFVQSKQQFTNGDVDKICHVARVYEVKRFKSVYEGLEVDTVEFFISHQAGGGILLRLLSKLNPKWGNPKAGGGRYEKWTALRLAEENGFVWRIFANTKYGECLWKKYRYGLSEIGKLSGVSDALSQVGVIYGFYVLALSIPKVSFFIAKYLNKSIVLGLDKLKRVCSRHLLVNGSKTKVSYDPPQMRYTEEEVVLNPFPTPEWLFVYDENMSVAERFRIVDFKQSIKS